MSKTTTLAGLEREIKKLAKERHCTVRHEITNYTSGKILKRWSTYIAGVGWSSDHASADGALREMTKKCKGDKK